MTPFEPAAVSVVSWLGIACLVLLAGISGWVLVGKLFDRMAK
jgi:hypothetical protein